MLNTATVGIRVWWPRSVAAGLALAAWLALCFAASTIVTGGNLAAGIASVSIWYTIYVAVAAVIKIIGVRHAAWIIPSAIGGLIAAAALVAVAVLILA